MTTTVNDIEHIESQSYNGVSVIKVFFHEGAKVEAGVAQVTSICQTLLRTMPPGTTAAAHHPIQRVERADHSARPLEQIAFRAAALRPRPQLRAHPARHGAGRADPAALRRKIAPDHGRSRPEQAHGEKHFPNRCQQRPQRAKRHPSRRHGKNRRPRIQRPPQLQPGGSRKTKRPPDQAGQRRDGLHPRRRQCPRRLCGADKHRLAKRRPQRAVDRFEKRQRLDASTSSSVSRKRSRKSKRRSPRRSTSRNFSTNRSSSARASTACCARASSPPA